MKLIQKYFLIIDYNLSRIRDVKKLSCYIKNKYGLGIILIKNMPHKECYSICDIVIELDPLANDFIKEASILLKPYDIKSGLVFSDNAIFSGSKLLKKLNILTDSVEKAKFSYDKYLFRCEENIFKNLLKEDLWIPRCEIVYNLQGLYEFYYKHKNFIVKPTKEGNNRGVFFIRNIDSISSSATLLQNYLDQGLICEEIIPYNNEFSYDGVGSLSFITQKFTLNGDYPVELAQALPPNINNLEVNLIKKVGSFANLIVGQRNEPFHNEIKIDKENLMAANVEPNRRPAGMQIWNLFEEIYGINLYELWIDSKLDPNFKLPSILEKKVNRVAISLMLPAHKTIIINKKFKPNIECILTHTFHSVLDSLDKNLTKSLKIIFIDNIFIYKDIINYPPLDNSDFLANVSFSFENINKLELNSLIYSIIREWQKNIESYFLNNL